VKFTVDGIRCEKSFEVTARAIESQVSVFI
jgi:hypothetical protein